jgi:diaminohydroxyphosphoribosylaminopyrimidine deaminase/5-amino-6-(5-phosphoribosylamino)uracil reductase
LFDTSLAPTLVVTTDHADPDRIAAWLGAGADVEVVGFANSATGHGVDLMATLTLLGGRGVLQALVEGGAALHGALLAAGLVDRLVVYVGNTLLGVHGLPTLAAPGPASMAQARRLHLDDVRRFGDDIRLDYATREH